MTADLKQAAQIALLALEYHTQQTRPITQTEEAIKVLMEALAAHCAQAPAEAHGLGEVARQRIGQWLTREMNAAVRNGANSVSMPDELVEIAAWLSGANVQPKGMPAEWLDAFEEWRQTLGAADLDGKRDLVWRHIAGTGFQAGAAWARSQAPAPVAEKPTKGFSTPYGDADDSGEAPAMDFEPVAWMYERDGMVHDADHPPICTTNRWQRPVAEPWTETPLYAVPVPPGMALVPVTPTPEMLIAGCDADEIYVREDVPEMWAAMLAAAPASPSPAVGAEAALAHIAAIAHEGGLAKLNEHGAMCHIRRLCLPYWDDKGNHAQQTQRVQEAIDAALGKSKPPVQGSES